MKYDPKMSIEEWADKVRKYEYGLALQNIAKGEDVNLVMEAMSMRILEKLKYPMLRAIKEWGKDTYDATLSRENYEKNYLKKVKPRADHMNDVTGMT
jgi:hypothetical protein